MQTKKQAHMTANRRNGKNFGLKTFNLSNLL